MFITLGTSGNQKVTVVLFSTALAFSSWSISLLHDEIEDSSILSAIEQRLVEFSKSVINTRTGG